MRSLQGVGLTYTPKYFMIGGIISLIHVIIERVESAAALIKFLFF